MCTVSVLNCTSQIRSPTSVRWDWYHNKPCILTIVYNVPLRILFTNHGKQCYAPYFKQILTYGIHNLSRGLAFVTLFGILPFSCKQMCIGMTLSNNNAVANQSCLYSPIEKRHDDILCDVL
eukprot:704621_1